MVWICLAFAFLMLFLEFYLPGGLSLGIGIMLFIISIVQAYNFFGPKAAVIVFLIIVIGSAVLTKIALTVLKNYGKKKNTFYLSTDQEGYVSVDKLNAFVGKEGIADSDLRPSGFILIDAKRIQALCQGRYIEKGERVFVLESRGGYVIVGLSSKR